MESVRITLMRSSLFFLLFLTISAGTDADGAGPSAGRHAATECSPDQMPWLESLDALANAMRREKRSDKATRHSYQYMYYNTLAPLARSRCGGKTSEERTVRILEIGLGCGDPKLSPGGSVAIWRSLFPHSINLQLHVLEFAEACAKAWVANNSWPGLTVHFGDQSSPADLDRVYAEAGSRQFDIIIDDGSHLNEHQINTSTHLLTSRRLVPGGSYIIEDTFSACQDWVANVPAGAGRGHVKVGGAPDCMESPHSHKRTIFAALVEWQRELTRHRGDPFEGVAVSHIGVYREAAVIQISGYRSPPPDKGAGGK